MRHSDKHRGCGIWVRHATWLGAMASLAGCIGDDSSSGSIAWQVPACTSISGISSIAISPNTGNTLIVPDAAPVGSAEEGVYSIVPLAGVSNRVLAFYNGEDAPNAVPPAIYRSNDAGCRWTKAETLSARGAMLKPGGPDYAVGWTYEGGQSFVFVTDAQGHLLNTTTFAGDTEGLAVSAVDADHIRRIGSDMSIRDNRRRGRGAWITQASVPASIVSVLSVGFDRQDIDRISVGGLLGIVTTANGGATWAAGAFDTGPATSVPVHSVAFSADGDVIWARGYDQIADVWRLYRSSDGGSNFVTVASEGPDVVMVNSLVPHPTDPERVYWSGGRFGDPTTHLYQYSSATGLVTRVELSDGSPFFDVHGFAFHPTDPAYIYFGLIWPGQ